MDAAEFLTGLFAAPGVAIVPHEKTNSQQAIRREATTEDGSKVVDGSDALGATPEIEWIKRPDVNGVMGWEPRFLPESMRWWGRCTFEQLPTGSWLRPQRKE